MNTIFVGEGGDMGTRARLRVAQVARSQGVGIRELARLSDVNYPSVHDIWHNRGNPTLETLTKLADALRVPLSDLLEEGARIEV